MREFEDQHRNTGNAGRGGDATDNWNIILKENPFTVPEGYFADLETVTRFRTRHFNLTNRNYPVPADYFETLEQAITTKIAEEELQKRVPPMLEKMPEGYFAALEERILAKTVGQQLPPTRIAPVRTQTRARTPGRPSVRRMFKPSWVKYATAACLLLVSSLLITNKLKPHANSYNLSGIPDQELINYLQMYSSSRDVLLLSEYVLDGEQTIDLHSDISTDEIELYLENTL